MKRLSSVERGKIGPNKNLPAEGQEMVWPERADALADKISKWWQGDTHVHSSFSSREEYGHIEGIYNLDEIIEYYKSLGLKFAVFAEHASNPAKPEAQSPESKICLSLLKEAQEISESNQNNPEGFVAFSGVEANILFDENGQPVLDLPDEVLGQLDFVIASRHAIDREKEPAAIKETLLFAAGNPCVDVIGHPDRYTRKDGEQPKEYWDEYWAIWPEVLAAMAQNKKAFEINLNNPPAPRLIKMAAKAGLEFVIDYDAHDFDQYQKGGSDQELLLAGKQVKQKLAQQELSTEDLAEFGAYKEKRLSSGPGVIAILKLSRLIKKLETLGVTPDRVINSSKENIIRFLVEERGKKPASFK